MLAVGERIINIEWVMQLRMGLTKDDDMPPVRLMEEELPDGRFKGAKIDMCQNGKDNGSR